MNKFEAILNSALCYLSLPSIDVKSFNEIVECEGDIFFEGDVIILQNLLMISLVSIQKYLSGEKFYIHVKKENSFVETRIVFQNPTTADAQDALSSRNQLLSDLKISESILVSEFGGRFLLECGHQYTIVSLYIPR